MAPRDNLHRLVDTLPESEMARAERVLEALRLVADPPYRPLEFEKSLYVRAGLLPMVGRVTIPVGVLLKPPKKGPVGSSTPGGRGASKRLTASPRSEEEQGPPC
jgi:hypothetical protein